MIVTPSVKSGSGLRPSGTPLTGLFARTVENLGSIIFTPVSGVEVIQPLAKDKLADIAEKYLKAKGDPDKELAWWNTQMGLPHRPNYGKRLPVDVLLARREVFNAEVPEGVAVLTAGIDTQNDRLEVEVVGWGKDEESCSVAFDVIEGDLESAEPLLRLDAYLKQVWRRADGRGFTIMAACHDSGGNYTQKVYEFSQERLGRRIWAIKGESAKGDTVAYIITIVI